MPTRTTTAIQSQEEIEYPDSNGQPMGETGIHVNVITTVLDVIRRHYRGNPKVAVLANMFLYYVEGDPSKNVAPDLFVTLKVPSDTTRRTFKVWEEGKAPDLVIEVTSKKTKYEDQHEKFPLYRDVLKVREYFLFDPEEEYLEPSLQGFRLIGGLHLPIRPKMGRLPSRILGLHLERDGLDLRLYDPRSGRWLPTGEELEEELQQSKTARRKAEAARRKAEADQRREAAARREAEAEPERLQRELDALRKKMPQEF
jgi:Uma2 family endonuclease